MLGVWILVAMTTATFPPGVEVLSAIVRKLPSGAAVADKVRTEVPLPELLAAVPTPLPAAKVMDWFVPLRSSKAPLLTATLAAAGPKVPVPLSFNVPAAMVVPPV